MWILLILPTLLFADVDPVDMPLESNDVTQAYTLSAEAPVNVKTTPTSKEVAKTALPNVSVPISKTVSTAADRIGLRLKPSMSSPVVLALSKEEAQASSQDTGIVAEGQKWMSVEHAVTLTGFVEKTAIDKDLSIDRGTIVWSSPDKAEQLTVIDNPASVKLLEVDHMGKVEVIEPRVLYYGLPTQPVVETTGAGPTGATAEQKSMDATAKRRGSASDLTDSHLRSIEGVLRKGNPLLGRKLFINDAHGQRICKIDPNSPIDWLTFNQYVGHVAVFVGE
ncbi:hypothetical protein EB093_10055, partial [bacterium]|nr:hypothetical protein [bacterium]